MFKWQDHITLGKGFTEAERKLLSRALDAIAAAHDGEGQDLIRYAAQQQKGKLTIVPSSYGNFLDEEKRELSFNFTQSGRVAYTENGIARRVSLNGILVHELVHAADNHPSPGAFRDIVDTRLPSLLRKTEISPERIGQITTELHAISEKISPRHALKLLSQDGLARIISSDKLRREGYPALGKLLESTSPDMIIAMYQQAGQIDAKGIDHAENRAVAFTDYFMWKNHGRAEPQRLSYDNGTLVDPPQPLAVLKVAEAAHPGNAMPLYRHEGGQAANKNSLSAIGMLPFSYAIRDVQDIPATESMAVLARWATSAGTAGRGV